MARLRNAAIAVLAAAMLVPATAGAEGELPTFTQQDVWFNCDGQDAKVVNASAKIPGWDTTKPTASVQSGAGCGQLDPAFLINTVENTSQADASWTGTFTGNLNQLTVELHSIYAGTARTGAQKFGFTPKLYIDGELISFDKAILEATPVPSATKASEMIRFSLTNLNVVDDLNADGIADPGPGTTEHTITLQAANQYINTNGLGAWVWDTSEVPAGISFNSATTEATQASRS